MRIVLRYYKLPLMYSTRLVSGQQIDSLNNSPNTSLYRLRKVWLDVLGSETN